MATCTSTDSNPNSHPETDLSDKEATQPGKYQLQEGHEFSFVKQPPKEIQLECSICLQFLSDPCHSDCECGNSFCRACIETVEEMNNPCPLCNERFGIIIPSKQLKRTLNSLQIYCTHKDEGCEWIDELGRLSDHFNVSPTVDSKVVNSLLLPAGIVTNIFPEGISLTTRPTFVLTNRTLVSIVTTHPSTTISQTTTGMCV